MADRLRGRCRSFEIYFIGQETRTQSIIVGVTYFSLYRSRCLRIGALVVALRPVDDAAP